jgi:radical SAM protein with 4Fe4S-binding SPASM domain
MYKFLSTLPNGQIGLNIVCKETCSIGTSPVIGPTGEVYPCYLTRVDDLSVGNVRQQSLSEIWTSSPLLKELMNWNVDQIDECRGCWNKLYCGGGCRGHAYFHHGTVNAKDNYVCAANQAMAHEIFRHGNPATRAALEELITLAGHPEQLTVWASRKSQEVQGA